MKLRLLYSLIFSLIAFVAMGQITSVGLIGTATPGGWDVDTDMVQDPVDPDVWTLDIMLVEGAAKFRADDDWAVNWGNLAFPVGIGEQDGPDITVTHAGMYSVTFNSATGLYYFEIDSPIGIIGSATPFGWDSDTNMFQDTINTDIYTLTVDLLMGEAKFRQDDDWAVNWGSEDFPSGTGVQDGANIPIPATGTYEITFNAATGEYDFSEIIAFETIGIIGDATPGGWDTDTDMTKDASNPDVWRASLTLTDGEAKFRANDDWAVSWGSEDFPTGVAEINGPNIPVTAGDYLITFNTATGEYSFVVIPDFSTIGLIGDATPGGWDTDTDLEQDPDDKSLWNGRMILMDGEAKFRADDDWAVNWGSGDFPTGVGVQDGANIPVTAGEYIITFNSTTGAYNFKEIVVFNTVGIIGTGSPIGDWDTDVDMEKSPQDEQLWTLSPITLSDGEIKFRAEDDWAVNWGAEDFPTGVGVQDGPNIQSVAGTYSAVLNSETGEYAFSDPTSTEELLDPSSIDVYPNPAHHLVTVEFNDDRISGMVKITVMDVSGKIMIAQTASANDDVQVNVSQLNAGNYLMQISNERFIIGKRISVVK